MVRRRYRSAGRPDLFVLPGEGFRVRLHPGDFAGQRRRGGEYHCDHSAEASLDRSGFGAEGFGSVAGDSD